MPEASRSELVANRRQELLEKGFRAGIVGKAMDWACGSAEGMANYISKLGGSDGAVDELALQFLPRYLQDAEKWIKSFVGEPEDQ
ncbi:hypothetical protein LCGC14_1527530 [marine sediment metagenome]|uniref:Uncharacterized protein n=1 Tax=marine sediment metagenome TaxID=412755 RepID=A0A0F9JHR0_9ZZZZ